MVVRCTNQSTRQVSGLASQRLALAVLVATSLSTSTLAFRASNSISQWTNLQTVPCANLRALKVDEQEDYLINGSRINGLKSSSSDDNNVPQAPQRKTPAFFFADISGGSESKLPMIKTQSSMPPIEIDQTQKIAMLGLLWITACLSALDRVAMSVALIPMSTEFGLTDTIKGSISSFFSIGYGLGIIPAGIILSFASPRIVMSVAVVSWSLATLATPWAAQGLALGSTATTLLLIRACVGAAESLVMPTLQRILLTWTTAEEKALGMATVITGFQAGTIAAYLLSPVVMTSFGDGDAWRELFYVYGAFGMVLLLPWLFLAKDDPVPSDKTLTLAANVVEDTPFLKEAPNKLRDAVQLFKDAPWLEFARSKGAWAMLLAHCSRNWGLYNFLSWTPTFYFEQYGIGVRESAWLSVSPSIAGAVCGLVAGNLADAILRRQQDANDGVIEEEQLTNIRKVFQGVALYGPAASMAALAVNIPDDPVVAQGFLMTIVGLQAFSAAGFDAANQEKAGPRWTSLLYSVTSLPAVLFGTFGVYCVGQVLDATNQDWSLVWGINAVINVLGATAFVTMYNSKREFD